MISPGALVTVTQFGTQLWVVRRPASGGRWYLTGKQVDDKGGAAYRGHIAGAGDITIIRDAPVYEVGDIVERVWLSGPALNYIVLADLGDDVELGVPSDHVPKHGRYDYTVHIPAGRTTTVSKADLILEAMS
jgi:hypothetical protein